jgi:hypothetical protein
LITTNDWNAKIDASHDDAPPFGKRIPPGRVNRVLETFVALMKFANSRKQPRLVLLRHFVRKRYNENIKREISMNEGIIIIDLLR